MNKVLFLSYYFPPMGMGGTQRSAKFVKYLPAFNWEPVVVTVKDVKYYAQDLTLLDEIQNRKIIRTESLDPLRLLARFSNSNKSADEEKKHSTKSTSHFLNFLNKTFVNWFLIPDSKILWLPFVLVTSIRLIKKYKIKIIYTTSPPHSAHIGGLLLKWICRVKWVADFRDDWTGGESQPNPTIFHTFFNRLMEKIVLKYADHIVSMCDFLTDNLKSKSGYFKTNNFSTIANGYDAEDFAGLLNSPLHSKFTITHCGSISKVSNPDSFLRAIHFLFEQKPDLRKNFQIQFLGTDIFGYLEDGIKNYGLEKNILPIKYLQHRDALLEIMKSHLLLLTITKQTNEEIITGKIFEYLGSGKPILLISGDGEVARMIRNHNRGTSVQNKNIDGIIKSINNYYEMYQIGRLKFDEPLSIKQFERKKLTGQLVKIFLKLI